jgi:selenocysteine lyase/cysteine desulfurase
VSSKLACQRNLFDLPNDVTYLNAAYMGPLSDTVVAAGREGLERKRRPWTITAPDFFDGVERVRELFAELIGGDADGVALLPAVSYGVALAARNLRVRPGGRIVVLEAEFPSNYYAWAEKAGAEVVTVRRPDDGDWTAAVLESIDDRTDIVATSQVHWTDGGLCDLVRIGERTREARAALVVDATQSIGAMPFDVARIRPDFVITAVYKWLLAPYGAALLWCGESRREGDPLEYSWITRRNADDFPTLVDYRAAYREGARRYDVGQTSNFGMVPAIEAALRQTLGWSVDAVASYTQALTDRIAARAGELGLRVASREHRGNHLIGVRLGGADPTLVSKAMAERCVYVSVRGDAVRVSPHVYNDEADVDRFADALASAM